jgi:hypothetical protein
LTITQQVVWFCPRLFELIELERLQAWSIPRRWKELSSHPKFIVNLLPKPLIKVCAIRDNEAAPEVLGVLPQDLDSIELRAIGRQIVQIQRMFRPLASRLVY